MKSIDHIVLHCECKNKGIMKATFSLFGIVCDLPFSVTETLLAGMTSFFFWWEENAGCGRITCTQPPLSLFLYFFGELEGKKCKSNKKMRSQ